MKIDFKLIKLVDINGVVIEGSEIHKIIANIVYERAANLDLVDIAMRMNRGEVVDLGVAEVKEVRGLVANNKDRLSAFARKAVCDFLDSVGKAGTEKERLTAKVTKEESQSSQRGK